MNTNPLARDAGGEEGDAMVGTCQKCGKVGTSLWLGENGFDGDPIFLCDEHGPGQPLESGPCQWKHFDLYLCPRCGNDLEVYINSADGSVHYGDAIRCVECGFRSHLLLDGSGRWVALEDAKDLKGEK